MGLDLETCVEAEEVTISAGEFIDVPTGLSIKLPENVWASIRPRSSTFAKRRLIVFDGTVDNGFVGELFVMVYNPNKYDVTIKKGDRLAQLVLHPMVKCDIVYTHELPQTERGQTGFGSTD